MAGDLTRNQMTTEVCDIVGKRVTATAPSATTLKSRVETYYMNWAQRRIARAHNFHELNTRKEDAATVASTKRYPMITGSNNLGLTRPKDISSIILIDGSSSYPLRRWDARKFTKRIPRPENYAESRPRIYTRFGMNLDLFYIPDAVYTLHILYPQWPTPLTGDSQTSDFNDKDELIIATTVMETYLALEEYKDAAIWFQKVQGLLQDAKGVEGDLDWEPEAEAFDPGGRIGHGEPWLMPGADPGDPLYDYPEGS